MRSAPFAGQRVAVIGMSGRFPGAPTIQDYWRNIRMGTESITFFTEAEAIESGVDPEALRAPDYVAARGVIDDPDRFDAALFGFSAREAELLDPQHRVFLECAWEALEDASCDPARFAGRIGVYAGCRFSSYILTNLLSQLDTLFPDHATLALMVGNDRDFLATRVSYKLGLRGPSFAVQSACSTSLVALHVAVQSLLCGDCDVALAGGVTIRTPLRAGYVAPSGGLFAADGHCRPFDADADGVVSGDGVGIVVLKRLEDARADRDHIQAVVLATAANNDGADRMGYTAPSPNGQSIVIADALARAAADADSIRYVEAHGTGTALGDPIEVSALSRAYGASQGGVSSCALGSVKANVGHLDAAAGIASFIKGALIVKHGELPPHPNFSRENPRLQLDSGRFYVNRELAPWPDLARPRRAGVSSLGLGGTNVHAIVEEPPPCDGGGSSADWNVLVLSAGSRASLDALTARMAAHLRDVPHDPNDVAFSLQVGRRALRHRRAVLCAPSEDLAPALAGGTPDRTWTAVVEPGSPAVGFLLPGVGDDYPHMASELYASSEVFRDAFDRCRDSGRATHNMSLPQPPAPPDGPAADGLPDLRHMLGAAPARHESISLAHAALFAFEYSLASLWAAYGVTAAALLGYSLGEYVAACLAGVLTLDDALSLVIDRAELVQSLPPGELLAVPLSRRMLQPHLAGGVEVAVVNGEALTVVAGSVAAIEATEAELLRTGVASRRLQSSHAFHTSAMRPAAAAFRRCVARYELRTPARPYVSNVTGRWITPAEATSPDYWVEHLCRPVQFADGLLTLRSDVTALLEVGPGRTLGVLARQCFDREDGIAIAASVAHAYERQPQRATMLEALARMWTAGVEIDWQAVHHVPRRRVSLPTYAFDRQRYWIAPRQAKSAGDGAPDARLEDVRLSVPVWRQVPAYDPADRRGGTTWVLFERSSEVAEGIARRAEAAGHSIVRVRLGEAWSFDGHTASIAAAAPDDYERLLTELTSRGMRQPMLVHLGHLDALPFDGVVASGFESLRLLGRALGRASGAGPIRIAAISQAGFDVLGGERVSPEDAMMLGVCNAIAKEYADVTCRQIDMPSRDQLRHETLDALVREIERETSEPLTAVRGMRVWVRGFEMIAHAGRRTPRLRSRGVYLITGGLGGVGLELARYLARATAGHLVLTARTPLPERHEWDCVMADARHPLAARLHALTALERVAASVTTASVDATDAAGMARLVERVHACHGPIAGVIHAAGTAGGGLLQGAGAASSAAIMHPKVSGTRTVAALFEDRPLDFFALCSSMSAILGGFAHADYAAANAYQDAFSHQQHARGADWFTAINWAAWKGIGVAALDRLPESLRRWRESEVARGLTAEEGADAFGRVLSLRAAQVAVHRGEIETLLREDRQWSPARAHEELERSTRTGLAHRRPALHTPFAAPETDLERQVLEIWEDTLGVSGLGVHDNFFELGGHSLLVLRIAVQLRERVGVDVPLSALLERPTVRHQVAEIMHRGRHPAGSPIPTQRPARATLESLVDEIEQRPESAV